MPEADEGNEGDGSGVDWTVRLREVERLEPDEVEAGEEIFSVEFELSGLGVSGSLTALVTDPDDETTVVVEALEPVALRPAEPLLADKVSATFPDADALRQEAADVVAERVVHYSLWAPTHPAAADEDEATHRVRHAAKWVRVSEAYADPEEDEDGGRGECRGDDGWWHPARVASEGVPSST